MCSPKSASADNTAVHMGPGVQRVVSLTSLLRVISLNVLADLIYNILIFFAGKFDGTLSSTLVSVKLYTQHGQELQPKPLHYA